MSYGYPSLNGQSRHPYQGPGVAMGPSGSSVPQNRVKEHSYNQYSMGANTVVAPHSSNTASNKLPNLASRPQNYHRVPQNQHHLFPQQQSYPGGPNQRNFNQQPLVSPPSNNNLSPQVEQFTGITVTPIQDSFDFIQSPSNNLTFDNVARPTLPPKIPIQFATPPSAGIPNNNTINDSLSQGFYQKNHSISSDTNSSVDDLIDRYMEEITQLDDHTSENVSQIRNENRLRTPSIIKELEIDSPPPYEELENLPVGNNYQKNEKSSYQPQVRSQNTTVEGTSKEAQTIPKNSHQSISSGTSSMKSLPYPVDDPVGEKLEDNAVPIQRNRRYTDELLEQLKNTNINDAEKETSTHQRDENLAAIEVSKQSDPIEAFIKSRNDALQNYKMFSLDIQLKWAKTLLEAIDNPQVVNNININGQRMKPLTNPKDIKKNKIKFLSTSIKLLKKISDTHDNAESQKILGDLYSGYSLAELTEKDTQKGYEFYLRATKGKDANATYKTGCCLEHGMGCKRDITKCFYFYEKSALLGDADGMCKLGIIYIKGLLGQAKSAQKSVYWLNKAILTNKTAVLPIFILAKIHETDIATLDLKPHKNDIDADVVKELQRLKIHRDFKTALQLYLKSAKLGHTKSQSHLGYCYEYGSMGCPVDPRTSIYWYSKAAQKGDLNAEMGLSGWYLTGAEGLLAQSDTEAYLWARKASDKGLTKAEYAVGYFNEVGVGTSKNLNEAKKWYKIAASQGYSKAIKKLENLR